MVLASSPVTPLAAEWPSQLSSTNRRVSLLLGIRGLVSSSHQPLVPPLPIRPVLRRQQALPLSALSLTPARPRSPSEGSLCRPRQAGSHLDPPAAEQEFCFVSIPQWPWVGGHLCSAGCGPRLREGLPVKHREWAGSRRVPGSRGKGDALVGLVPPRLGNTSNTNGSGPRPM